MTTRMSNVKSPQTGKKVVAESEVLGIGSKPFMSVETAQSNMDERQAQKERHRWIFLDTALSTGTARHVKITVSVSLPFHVRYTAAGLYPLLLKNNEGSLQMIKVIKIESAINKGNKNK